MRAWTVDAPGGPEALVLGTMPDPEPGPEDAVIDVAFAAANWSDIQKREGVYPDPVIYPAVIGLEVSGRIAALGGNVRGLSVGQRVAAITGPTMLGGYAEKCRVGARYIIPLPDSISLEAGAAFPVASLTAYHLLHSAHELKAGETVLVHSIGGAVGLLVTQIAVLRGATVIGTVGWPGKGARVESYGAALVINRSRQDFVAEALAFTNGNGVDLVIDSLGADILPRSFDALKTFGRVINIGEAAGYPDFAIRPKLYERSTSLAGFEVLHAMRDPDRWSRGLRFVCDALADGRLEVPVEGVLAFEAARDLHRRLESRTVSGKLLLEVA